MAHISITDLDLNKLQMGKSNRTIKLLYNNAPLQLVTSKMYTPFGVKVNNSDYSHFTNCHLDSSLNQSNSESSLKVKEMFLQLDNKIIELIKDNIGLFNQKDTNDINLDNNENTFYSPIFKGNSNYPKLMKISLPRDKNGNFDFVIFDENKEKVPVTDKNIETILAKGKIFKAILECSKVWIYKGKIGTTWNLVQMRFVARNDASDPDPDEVDNSNSNIKNIYTQNLMLDDD
jgi:hypothetical protein